MENHWKTIIETVQDGLMIVDPEGRIMAVNPAAEALTGYTRAELVGQSCRVLNCTGCRIRENHMDKWCGLFAKGQVRSKRCTITAKNKRDIYILKSASVIYGQNGETIGAVEILTDISDSIRQQEKIISLRKTLNMENGYHDLIGRSPAMRRLFELIESVAPSDAPVMILGPSGTGKELTAMAIHEASPRQDGSFIKVNCAALNENVLESELFGHVKGAFTGAERNRAGRFEAASGGSIFLDEIGDIPHSTQVKLLRVLEENIIERVGDNQSIPVDVRIITATNKDIERMVAAGSFREDLFFRINVFPLNCPPLSARREDIPLLIQNFITYNAAKDGKRIAGLTPEAMERMMSYDWPGNVRELRNTIEYARVLCPGGLIDVRHLPQRLSNRNARPESRQDPPTPLKKEREQLLAALRETGGNQSKAADILGVSRVTVWKRIKKHKIDLAGDL